MKRLSVVFVTSILAFALLFGVLLGQTGVAHAASIPNSTQRSTNVNTMQTLISEVHLYVHVVNHHATIDLKIKPLVSQKQFQAIEKAVSEYNTLSTSPNTMLSTSSNTTLPAMAKPLSKSPNASSAWFCFYISNGLMDQIAWGIIFGGTIDTIAGIILTVLSAGWGAVLAVAAVLVGFGGVYLLWYSDKYWPNGTTWCSNGSSVYYYVD